MEKLLLSALSPKVISWGGSVVLISAMLGEVAVNLIPEKRSAHRAAAFGFAALAVAGYAVERIGDDAITTRQIAAIRERLNRVISLDTHNVLVSLLKDAPKGRVIDSASMDAEATQFGDQILSVFKRCRIRRDDAFLWRPRYVLYDSGRVSLDKKPKRHTGPCRRYLQAFESVGISLSPFQEASVPDEQTVVIAISSHP